MPEREARYGKGKPRKDMFVGYLMNLKYIVESGSIDLGGRKKKLAIEAILGLNLYEFERYIRCNWRNDTGLI